MNARTHDALFQTVVDTFGAALQRLCATYERNEAARHELQQEVLLNIWRALPGFRGEASLRTWVYRIAHNTAARHVHKAVHRVSTASMDTPSAQRASSGQTPEHALEDADASSVLRNAIGALRPLDQQVILLYLEDVPQKEIGEITGLTQANVSTRIHRIKTELKKRLSP